MIRDTLKHVNKFDSIVVMINYNKSREDEEGKGVMWNEMCAHTHTRHPLIISFVNYFLSSNITYQN